MLLLVILILEIVSILVNESDHLQWDLPKCKLTGPGFWRALREGVHLGDIQSRYDTKIANNIAHMSLCYTVIARLFSATFIVFNINKSVSEQSRVAHRLI